MIQAAPNATVHPRARLAEGVTIGPGAVVGEHVTVGRGTSIGPGAVIEGWTTIGSECQIGPYAIIGGPPQHTKYAGERSYVEIGDRNVLREFATVHRGWGEEQKTVIGHDNYFMVGAHVAHNCVVGSHVIMTNGAGLAGHVVLEDFAVLGAYVGVVQWLRVGTMAMVGVLSKVVKDIPPYVIADGNPLSISDLNTVGLGRNGVSPESRKALKQAYKIFFGGTYLVEEALRAIEREVPQVNEVRRFVEFIRQPSKHGVYRTSGGR